MNPHGSQHDILVGTSHAPLPSTLLRSGPTASSPLALVGLESRLLGTEQNGASTNGAPATPEQRSTEFRAVEGGPEIASGTTLLVEAYAAIWLILLGFLVIGWRRQVKIDTRVDELERALRSARRAEDRTAATS